MNCLKLKVIRLLQNEYLIFNRRFYAIYLPCVLIPFSHIAKIYCQNIGINHLFLSSDFKSRDKIFHLYFPCSLCSRIHLIFILLQMSGKHKIWQRKKMSPPMFCFMLNTSYYKRFVFLFGQR